MSATKEAKPAPEVFDLPDTVDLAAVDAAEIEIIRLAAQRRMSALAALRFIRMLDFRRRIIADRALLQEMERLEQEGKTEGAEA
jgi:hypothetical protein